MPSECASIGVSPGPTDHMYNAGYGHASGYDGTPFLPGGQTGNNIRRPGNDQSKV